VDPARPTDEQPPTDEAAAAQSRVRAIMELGRDRVTASRSWATDLLERHRQHTLVDLGLRIYERDRESAGTIVGSAIAFRLFLFFVPFLLFVVGLTGFFAHHVTADDVDEAGITGNLAAQINTALAQPNSTRWIAVIVGFVGMATTGRTLSKSLAQASCLAWRMPMHTKASIRVISSIVGLLAGMAILSTIVNRIRQQLGLAGAGLSLLAVFGIYSVLALVLAALLPRPTSDPGVLLPGAVLVGGTITALQAVSQLYLPDRFSRASELYGAIGATVVTLGWFFIAGRVMVVAIVIDAAVFERFGSITGFVFGLPVARALPRRSAWLRRQFDLDAPAQE
jgi:uncharacterized BrkB/YihY/UPF0761 family membrane protein